MLTYLKDLLFDKASFFGLIRGAVGAAAFLVAGGYVEQLPPWAGAVVGGLAMFMRSSSNERAKERPR